MKKLSIHAPLIQEAETKELSNLQKDWREYFGAKLAKFGVDSPAELDEEKKKEFFNDLKKDWEKGKGIKPEAKEELEKDKEKAEDKKAEEPAEEVADLKGSAEDKLKELTKEGEEAINEFGGDFTKEYDGFIVLDVKNQKTWKFRYIKGVKGVKAEDEAIAKLMKKTGQPRSVFMVHGSIKKGEFDKTDELSGLKVEVLESVNEGRSIETVSKDISKLAAEMMDLAKVWKTAEGKAKTDVLDTLKAKTAEKKDLEKELNDIIAGKDKDIELIVMEAESIDEAEVKTEAEFKEYAQKVLKKAHPDDFDEDKANKTIDGILKKADGDFGAAVGMLTSSLG